MTNNSSFVTIIVPAYNAAATIKETLDSLLAQRNVEFEIIVSDNHSTDNTADIVRSYSDSRISLVTCPVPPPDSDGDPLSISLSSCAHGNTLLDYGKGELLCIFHADDVYEPYIVSKEAAFMNKYPQAGAVFTLGRIINENGDFCYGQPRPLPKPVRHIELFDFSALFESTLLYGAFIMCPTLMTRRSVYKKVGGPRAEYEQASDYDQWFRLATEAPIGIIQEHLFFRRISNNQDSYRGRSIYHYRPLPIFKVYDHFLATTDVAQKISTDALRALNVSRSIDLLRIARNCFTDHHVSEAKNKIHKALISGRPKPAKLRDRVFIWAGWILWGCTQLGFGGIIARLQSKLLAQWKQRRLKVKLT
ncbi:MAG: glycosyltransferase [Sedimentisphaerales bacterium]|nr:glycosyltransferase [Sedimentisphaerales bacterium]